MYMNMDVRDSIDNSIYPSFSSYTYSRMVQDSSSDLIERYDSLAASFVNVRFSYWLPRRTNRQTYQIHMDDKCRPRLLHAVGSGAQPRRVKRRHATIF